ncbi:Glycolipid 2-alpha-mannosyltransferase 1 [Naganishia cerealis]|uniref:Glycolipid 2-alpha-mannosyltransferase 1 n=1 Tax=Naganishia cerealis TaxID=610337 RepID=A0ACC2VT84_9TREE|nr:Glycolipid 2-alpha-mannosyltransferase 1 [Naganishia cerealis]
MNRGSNARIIRFAVFALVLITCGFILLKGLSYLGSSLTPANVNPGAAKEVPLGEVNAPAGGVAGNAGAQAAGDLVNQAVQQSKVAPNKGEKVKATFVSLARNSDLHSLAGSIRSVEDRFNHQYNYDWVFLNDKEFSEEFKTEISALVSGKAIFGLIPAEQWGYPEWIDKEKAALVREEMKEKKIIYGDSVSYRHMCRYESGFFWRHEALEPYEFYWRVEPDTKIYCNIDYDVFKWMKDNNKAYGWTISLPEYIETIPTLWDTTKKFMAENPQFVHKNNMMDWISDDGGETYNKCHFWSNFEIASLDLWRSEAYRKYFEYLDKAGGFFYERWGDAPVHSIAAALFLSRDQIHFFNDVGYYHVPFHNCPVNKETRLKNKCVCNPNEDFSWKAYSCTGKFHKVNNIPRPKGWEDYTG